MRERRYSIFSGWSMTTTRPSRQGVIWLRAKVHRNYGRPVPAFTARDFWHAAICTAALDSVPVTSPAHSCYSCVGVSLVCGDIQTWLHRGYNDTYRPYESKGDVSAERQECIIWSDKRFNHAHADSDGVGLLTCFTWRIMFTSRVRVRALLIIQ